MQWRGWKVSGGNSDGGPVLEQTRHLDCGKRRLYHLRKLRSVHIPRLLVVNLYLCHQWCPAYGLLAWFASCTQAKQQAPQWVLKAAGRIIGTTLPAVSTIRPTTFSVCCPQGEGSDPVRQEQPDWPTACIHRLWGYSTLPLPPVPRPLPFLLFTHGQ